MPVHRTITITITITIKSIGHCAHMLAHRTCLQLSMAILPNIIQTSIIEVGPLLFVIVIVAIVLSSPGLKEAKNFGPCALNSHHHNAHLSSHNSCNFQETGGWSNAWAVSTQARVSSTELFQPTRGSTRLMNMPASSGTQSW